jgi:hypothetical protein
MGEGKKKPRIATEPIELEDVSIVKELELDSNIEVDVDLSVESDTDVVSVSATPKKEARRAIGTAPPAATAAANDAARVGDDWLDRLDL